MNYALLTVNLLLYRWPKGAGLECCEVFQLGRWWKTDMRTIDRMPEWKPISESEANEIIRNQ